MQCNTRADYEMLRAMTGNWQQEWMTLLEGRFITTGEALSEDPNAKLFRLGFTVEEVSSALGHKGYTPREAEWYASQPERFTQAKGVYKEQEGWKEAALAASTKEALDKAKEEKAAEIKAAFVVAERAPVTIGPYMVKGGAESGYALNAQLDMSIKYAELMPELKITTVTFFGVTGETITVPIELPIEHKDEIDGWDVCLAVGSAASAVTFKYARLLKSLAEARSIEDVRGISW